jgi:hypothetical protein
LQRRTIHIAKILFISFILVLATVNLSFSNAIQWSPDTRLTFDEYADWSPSITATSDGKLWVVWRSNRMGDYELFYTVFDGYNWSNETRLTFDPGFDDHPCVMEDNDGNIWVVWESDRGLANMTNQDLFCKIFNGTSWSDPVQLTNHTSGDAYPSIAQDSNGTIWLFWTSFRTFPGGEYDDGYNEVFYKTLNETGWSEPIQLTNDTNKPDMDPAVLADENGMIWVVWAKKNKLYYKVHYGTTWSYDSLLVYHASHNWYPSITQANDGNIWIAWSSDRDVNDNIYYKIFDGYIWTADTKLTSNILDDTYPSVAQDIHGTIWVTWASPRFANFDLYYTTNSHDIAVTNVAPQASTVTRGETLAIEVTALNLGTEDETVEVRCYANSILAGNETLSLTPGQSDTVTIQWNTTGVARDTYVISATAVAVPGEVKLDDNTLIDGSVQVEILGDVCGAYDGVVMPTPEGAVTRLDWVAVSLNRQTYDPDQYPGFPPWDPVWGPACDVDKNGAVDVDDLLLVALHYGET